MNPIARVARWIRGTVRKATRRIRGTYDAAQTSVENEDYWAWSDALNANAATSPDVRKTLRERARYERDNDGHLSGLVSKIARDLVGSGPRLQLLLPEKWTDPDFRVEQNTPPGGVREVERLFHEHCRRIGLPRKLRVMHESRIIDGESFGLLATNSALPSAGPRLDMRLYETDQIDTPFFMALDPLAFPGGYLDESGNVTEWHFLKTHPGSDVWNLRPYEFDRIAAGRVIHWAKVRRAGQIRGVSEVAAGLPLYAYLRRYTLATLASAETAAKFAAVLKVDAPPAPDNGEAPPIVSDMVEVPIPRGALLTTYGEISQLKAEQPTTSYGQYKGEILTEAGAAIGAPRNASTNSSAEYNYSSGRLDHLPYERMIGVERSDLREIALDPFFREWFREASKIKGYLPDGLPPPELWAWEWHFDGFDSIDPLKDAQTDQTELAIGKTNLAEIWARKGKDWEEGMRQRARELRLAVQLEADYGLPAGTLSTLQKPTPLPPAPEAAPNGTEQTAAA